MVHTMKMDAIVEPGLADKENPLDASYTSLNLLVMTAGAGAFVGELVTFKWKSNAAVVDETDAAIVEEVALPSSDAAVVVAAVFDVASVELVIVVMIAGAVDTAEVLAAAVAVVSVEVVGVTTKPPTGQQISSDCLIISQRASPFSCLAASGNKSAQVLPATVDKVKGAVMPPGQTTQEGPETAVVNVASVDAVTTVLLTKAAAVELTTTVVAAAAVVEPVSVVLIAATVVGTSGQQVLSNALIRPQIESSASN